jgi:SMI1 / KNR4 family (SUKH-1)
MNNFKGAIKMVEKTNQNDLFDWTTFLRQYSRDLLERLEDREFEEVPLEARNNQWLGYPAATEEEISLAESRLNVQLPPSYRTFLSITNGWLLFDDLFGGLLPVQQVERLPVRQQDLIDVWLEENVSVSDEEYFIYGSGQDSSSMRSEYLPDTLEIGGVASEGYTLLYPQTASSNLIMLNPQVRFNNGEWETWKFANWYPGAVRYRSFLEMMQISHSQTLESLPKIREI